MSEFTTGVLYPRVYETSLLHLLTGTRQSYFHKNVNDRWNAIFLQDEKLQNAETLFLLLDISARNIPLLWFHDDEENGWGFRLFDGGYEVSAATIWYDLDVYLAERTIQNKYHLPELSQALLDREELQSEFDETLRQVTRSHEFRQEVGKGISRFRWEGFSRLLTRKQVQQLRFLFDLKLLTEVDEETGACLLYDSVDLFKEILGIEEMMWVNYRYLASGGRDV